MGTKQSAIEIHADKCDICSTGALCSEGSELCAADINMGADPISLDKIAARVARMTPDERIAMELWLNSDMGASK